MGKLRSPYGRPGCNDDDAPICGSVCCNLVDPRGAAKDDTIPKIDGEEEIKELVIVGAGPHGHALVLRLLEPEADFLSDKERHHQAENKDRMRPPREVHQHVKKLSRGPRATLRSPSKKSRRKKQHAAARVPPPFSLEEVHTSVLIVDKHGGWMRGWKENFQSLRIEKLRSLMSAHTDPFDHRSLEYYAEAIGRGDELVTLPNLRQRDPHFTGPYQVPSTAIFEQFHDLLSRAYGIEDTVREGTVLSINPIQEEAGGDAPIFEVEIDFSSSTSSASAKIIRARRIALAMGPIFRATEPIWESSLPPIASKRVLHSHQILPFVKALSQTPCKLSKLLIVGGGITSAQLSLLAATFCGKVTLVQRSKMVPRHFDIANRWMGPKRGKLLCDFWRSDMHERAQQLKEARGGGTIPPEIIQELQDCKCLQLKEEVEVSEVYWMDGSLQVTLDDGSEPEAYDMIWLATGAQNHIDHYSALARLREVLPVSVTNGLPHLDTDLSWKAPAEEERNEPVWKQVARSRVWCMGALAALELGPDALNLIGARQGSVRVAQAIRRDFERQKLGLTSNDGEEDDCFAVRKPGHQ
ncbi:hypothetical protein ACHAXT_005658 [Thalassiosira profunda]